jgi:hypothetical protein
LDTVQCSQSATKNDPRLELDLCEMPCVLQLVMAKRAITYVARMNETLSRPEMNRDATPKQAIRPSWAKLPSRSLSLMMLGSIPVGASRRC